MNDETRPSLTYVVGAREAGWKLRSVLRVSMGLSKRLVSRLKLTETGLTLNGERAFTNRIVREGDRIGIQLAAEIMDADIVPEAMPISVLYEDGHLLIVDKPSGLVVHPTTGHYVHTLANGVAHYAGQRGESWRFRPVHRLDMDTSGVLAIAKNAFAHQQLAAQMAEGSVEKIYVAITDGVPPERAGVIDAPIGRLPGDPKRRAVIEGGAGSVTRYEVVWSNGRHAFLRLQLETGRTHQIRVHLQSVGCPVTGDAMYNAACAPEAVPPAHWTETTAFASRQMLHAAALGFRHPATGERLIVRAPLPPDMTAWLEQEAGKREAAAIYSAALKIPPVDY